MLCWGLFEQVGHGHMSYEYRRPIYYSIAVLLKTPSWYYRQYEITTVSSTTELTKREEGHADKQ